MEDRIGVGKRDGRTDGDNQHFRLEPLARLIQCGDDSRCRRCVVGLKVDHDSVPLLDRFGCSLVLVWRNAADRIGRKDDSLFGESPRNGELSLNLLSGGARSQCPDNHSANQRQCAKSHRSFSQALYI